MLSLRALVAGATQVAGSSRHLDKPAGRGQRMHESDVKIAARELGLPVLQPVKPATRSSSRHCGPGSPTWGS